MADLPTSLIYPNLLNDQTGGNLPLPQAALDDFPVNRLRLLAPLPRILKRHDLRGGFFPALFLEEDVVGGAGIERWVEVDQVNTGIRHILPQNSQIVAEVELVLVHGL